MQVQIHLAIEKGRHQNIARQERVYNNCTMNVLETEYHYLLICPKCLSSKSNITVQNLSKFVFFANRIRN